MCGSGTGSRGLTESLTMQRVFPQLVCWKSLSVSMLSRTAVSLLSSY